MPGEGFKNKGANSEYSTWFENVIEDDELMVFGRSWEGQYVEKGSERSEREVPTFVEYSSGWYIIIICMINRP